MTKAELYEAVRRILEDPAGFRFTDPILDRYADEGLRRIERAIGSVTSRLTLSLVQGQQSYTLPTSVRRVVDVTILPEQGSATGPIREVPFDEIPVDVSGESDPQIYALDMSSGVNGDQIGLVFYPPPARSTPDSIVVTYDRALVMGANAPIQSKYDLVLIRLTAAGCLSESEDETPLRKGEYLRDLAERELGDLSWHNSDSYMVMDRSFP